MRIYYLTIKSDKKDIYFWELNMVIQNELISCLAFFYKKQVAQKYKKYLIRTGAEEEKDIVIRSIQI